MSMRTVKTNLVMSHGLSDDLESAENEWRPRLYAWHSSSEYDTDKDIFVRAVEVQIEVPDDFDPVPSQVAALMREKEKATQEFAQKVAQINEQLARLQAIEHTEAP